MQRKNRATQALLGGQTQISELLRHTIIRLEHENAELKAMLRAHKAQVEQLSRRLESSGMVLADRTIN
ncbi:hypothetical protein D9M70_546890 [compost metagenome]